ncbi:MAG: urease accessory protein UreE [Pseudomonadota bacterium]
MPSAHSVAPLERGAAVDTITLDETGRHRRRMLMTSDNGVSFLLDLPEARLLRHGEGIILNDGRIIEVRAAPEPLFLVRARNRLHLLQLAWHLGNRHCPSQMLEDKILIRRDHTMRAMLETLGAAIETIDAPFDPEGGAFDGSHGHRHD